MNRFLIVLLFCSMPMAGQNYVDLLRIGYGQTSNTGFEGSTATTDIATFDASLTIPVPLSEKQVFITGFEYNHSNLALFPNQAITHLHSTLLKLGLSTTYSDRWSSTIVLLPKLASNYSGIESEDFFLGGFAVATLKKRENLTYRFGFYGSTEAFAFFGTPIFGWYYLSPNERFEMDMSLPISADVSYKLGGPTIGLDYFGIGRGYNLRQDGQPDRYVQQGALEFAAYVQMGLLEQSVLVRAKAGYSSSDYEVYTDGDTYGLGLSAFRFGDDRTRLNPEMNGAVFFRIEAIYRFNISNNSDPATEE